MGNRSERKNIESSSKGQGRHGSADCVTARPRLRDVPVEFASRDLAAKYDRFARWYDCVEGILDFLGVGKLRRAVFSEASGKVLEVAVGTGKNLYYYRSDCQIIAGDLSSEMLKVARKRAAKLNINVQFFLADAEALPFREHCFDTVGLIP